MNDVSVVPLEPSALDAAGEVLTRAFVDDPAYVWMFRRVKPRSDAVRLLKRGYLKLGMRSGTCFAIMRRGKVVGASILSRPDAQRTTWEYFVHGMAPLVFRTGYATTRDMLTLGGRLGGIRRQFGPPRTWFLTALGVDPSLQGTGLGTAGLAHQAATARRDGLPLTFFTMKRKNVDFYSRRGCRVLHREVFGGPAEFTCWLMTTAD